MVQWYWYWQEILTCDDGTGLGSVTLVQWYWYWQEILTWDYALAGGGSTRIPVLVDAAMSEERRVFL